MRSYGIVYDCKLMEIRRAFFAVWMGCGALFFVVDGGWRMPDAWETGAGWLRLCRRGADSWLAEICVVFKKSAV